MHECMIMFSHFLFLSFYFRSCHRVSCIPSPVPVSSFDNRFLFVSSSKHIAPSVNCKQSNCHCLGPSTTPYLPHCPQSRPVNLRPPRTFLSVYMSSSLPYFIATSSPCLALPPSFTSLTSRPLLLPPSERHPCLVSTVLLSRSPLLTPSY